MDRIDAAYNQLSPEEKQIVIDWAKSWGFDHPEYTNMETIDYKFFEDVEMHSFVFAIAKEVSQLKQTIQSNQNPKQGIGIEYASRFIGDDKSVIGFDVDTKGKVSNDPD